MRDYLNRFDPMPLQLGAVVRPKPEPTAEQKRIAAFREFEAKPKSLGDAVTLAAAPSTAPGLLELIADLEATANALCGAALIGLKQPEADSEGWIKWEGGECPVRPGTRIEVRTRVPGHDSLHHGFDFSQPSNSNFWRHDGMGNDIIAYRLIQEPKKPEADADGWVTWGGGKCPLAEGVEYEVIRHNGSRLVSCVNADDFHEDGIWNGKDDPEWLMNVAKYRVIG